MKNKLFKTFLCIIMLLFLYSTSITDVIVIDPGHGGVAPGAPAINDGDTLCWEKDINMEVGWALYDTLFSMGGFEYHFTRFTDSTVANWRRALFADTIGADIFVSIHHNSTAQANHEIQGTEVYHNCDSLTDTSFSDPYGGVPRQPWESFIFKKKV